MENNTEVVSSVEPSKKIKRVVRIKLWFKRITPFKSIKKNRIRYNNALVILLIGFILLLLSLLLEHNISTVDATVSEKKSHRSIDTFIINLLSHLSIGCIVFGALSILLDTEHWKDYFRERLSEVVNHKSYLKRVSKDSLIAIQANVLRTYFNDESIGGEEGFLRYYQNNIQHLIGSPIRVDVNATLIIKYYNNKETIEVDEEISWRCKSNNGTIQDQIRWAPEKGEFDDLNFKHIKLEHESLPVNGFGKREKIIPEKELVKQDGGYIYDIPNAEQLNNLKVTISVNFKNPTSRLIAWRMAYISKGVSISIVYPEDLTPAKEIFILGRDESYSESDDIPGYYKWSSDGNWVLPNEGVAFQLTTKK